MSDKKATAVGIGVGVAAVALGAAAAYFLTHEEDAATVTSAIRRSLGLPAAAESHSGHAGHHGHGHLHGGHGHSHDSHSHAHGEVSFADAAAWARKFDTAERDAWQKPEQLMTEVLTPIVRSMSEAPSGRRGGARDVVVADIGAGTGYLTMRIARAFPRALVLATDTEAGMREYLQSRATRDGITNIVVSTSTMTSAALPMPADILILCTVYHHIAASPEQRMAYLLDLNRHHMTPSGVVIVIEHKTSAIPAHIPAPLAHMRIERSDIIHEFEQAGFALSHAPAFMPYHHVLVFKRAEV